MVQYYVCDKGHIIEKVSPFPRLERAKERVKKIKTRMEKINDKDKKYCDKDGSIILSECSHCGHPFNWGSGITEDNLPQFCEKCGKKYPWEK